MLLVEGDATGGTHEALDSAREVAAEESFE